jgi:hypothetical protein
LFVNKPKPGGKVGQPQYRGNVIIDGQQFDLAGWKKQCGSESKTPGETYLSLKAILNMQTPAEDTTTPAF